MLEKLESRCPISIPITTLILDVEDLCNADPKKTHLFVDDFNFLPAGLQLYISMHFSEFYKFTMTKDIQTIFF